MRNDMRWQHVPEGFWGEERNLHIGQNVQYCQTRSEKDIPVQSVNSYEQ